MLCEDKTPEDACGVCASCQKIEKLIHPDVHFFFPGPGKGGDNKEKAEKITQQQKVIWREFLTKGSPYQALEDWSQLVDAENKKTQISKELVIKFWLDGRNYRSVLYSNFPSKSKWLYLKY